MKPFARSDRSVLGRWWWTIDRWTLFALAAIMGFGILLIQAATPAVAIKHGLDNFYFVERHLLMLVVAIFIIFGISLLTPRQIRLGALFGLLLFLPMLMLTPFIGTEIKGATRWIHLPGLSIQPSEFVKPLFAVTAAWLFSRQCEHKGFPALSVNIALWLLITIFLVMQPDIGMTVLTTAIWIGEFFLAGLPIITLAIFIGLGAGGLVVAYYTLPHFTSRMDRFLSHSGDTYQVDRALDAFMNGGLLGKGAGEGTVKMSIPDAHADFVFAVAGEELGFIWCLVIIGLFAFIVLRGFWRLRHEGNLFILLSTSGLLIEFGLQAIINMASTLHLMPAKGMTLPFISYGGSSLWALAIGMGMLLGLTRKRFGLHDV
ncbi:MAG: cell division protein FtsW [Alphaproteobacteria bacterium]|nr:cell division protein FtsW [Alphaproteobacteria bacterium]MBV8547890.1 cell division protein FtsW [Alphaproteobacteria bacterium]